MDERNEVDAAPVDRRCSAIKACVSEQAEDEGLWFVASTVTEAYLQQALRHLHDVIEREFGPT